MARLMTLILTLGICLATSGFLPAQVTTGTLYGIVADASGAVIPGATATLLNEGTGIGNSVTTDERGEFAFTFVPVGSYTLRIVASGFKTLENKGLQVVAAQNIRQSFTLQVGQVTEQVSVTAAAALVNTVSAEQRENVSTRQVRELPVANRNIVFLGGLNAGAVATLGSSNDSGMFNFNGLGPGGSSVTVDGTDASGNSHAPTLMMYGGFNGIGAISLEAVDEVQTSKGVVSAEYARTLSGNFNVITKSGTNRWHGSLFENFQGRALNARDQFQSSKAAFTYNQFGGSVGGPIKRDKLFVFGTYEGYRQAAFSRVQGTVPTQRLRNDMLARFPDYKLALDAFPLPTFPVAPNDAVGTAERMDSTRGNDDQFVVKPDYWINSANKVTLTYTRSRPEKTTPSLVPLDPRNFNGWSDRLTGSYVTLGARWSAETRIGYNKNNVDRLDAFHDLVDPKQKETKEGGRRIPTIRGLGFDIGNSELMEHYGHSWSFEQKVSHQAGKHSLKFGGSMFIRVLAGSDIESPRIGYGSEADLLANLPNQVRVTLGTHPYSGAIKDLGFFLQDDWRVSRKLVVNLGLRYDYFGKYTANGTNGGGPHVYNPDGILNSQFAIGPFRPVNDPFSSDGRNFGPRLGFAYNPDGRGTNVIRGGLGVLFTPVAGEILDNATMDGPNIPFRVQYSKAEAQALGLRFPAYNEDVAKLVMGNLTGASYNVINPHIQAPYAIDYFLGYQRALTGSLMLESSFVANRGVKFQMRRPYNQPDRVTGVRPNPNIGNGIYFDNSESTHYVSWQSSLRKRFSRNLSGNMHYTWGKTISYGIGDILSTPADTQDFFNLRPNRGPATGDITHSLVSDVVYSLPMLAGKGNAIARQALGGWQVSGILSARTGATFTIIEKNSAYDFSRPDATGQDPIRSDYRTTLQYLNSAAFAIVPIVKASGASGRPGTLGRGAVRGPGAWNLDFSLSKNFPVRETVKFQVRADMFNSLNHTNFSGIDGTIESPTFGRITSAGARRIQMNARLTF